MSSRGQDAAGSSPETRSELPPEQILGLRKGPQECALPRAAAGATGPRPGLPASQEPRTHRRRLPRPAVATTGCACVCLDAPRPLCTGHQGRRNRRAGQRDARGQCRRTHSPTGVRITRGLSRRTSAQVQLTCGPSPHVDCAWAPPWGHPAARCNPGDREGAQGDQSPGQSPSSDRVSQALRDWCRFTEIYVRYFPLPREQARQAVAVLLTLVPGPPETSSVRSSWPTCHTHGPAPPQAHTYLQRTVGSPAVGQATTESCSLT